MGSNGEHFVDLYLVLQNLQFSAGWLKSHQDLVCKPCISAYKIRPYIPGTSGIRQVMIKTSLDRVDLHSHEKNPEPSLAL